MAVYYSEECAKEIMEKYDRIETSMSEVFAHNSHCTGAWTLVRWSLHKSERDLPYHDNFFNPLRRLSGHNRCSTIRGMDLVVMFFERKDFSKDEFMKLRNAGIRTVQKFEKVYTLLNGDDA